MRDQVNYAMLQAALRDSQLSIDPGDLHGSLIGYLCGGGSADAKHWLDALELGPADASIAPQAAALPGALVEQLYADCNAWLADPELKFEPLLPPDAAPLHERAAALGQWCRGFLGGLGLAGAGHAAALSPDANEILRDFASIAATRFEYENAEEDEGALIEVVEFVRVGTLLLHAELHAAPQSGATLH